MNIYVVSKKTPNNPLFLFDVSANDIEWDFYSLLHDELDIPYSYSIKKDDGTIDYSQCAEITPSILDSIIKDLDSSIRNNQRQKAILFKLGVQKPEDTAFEINRIQEYTEELLKRKHAIEFFKYLIERACVDYNSIEKFICYCD